MALQFVASRRYWCVAVMVVGGLVSLAASQGMQPALEKDTAAIAAEGPFWKENDAAMVKMMKDMEVKETGDVDKDFVDMMVPHHQGAIDMAEAVLKYGKNEQVRRLAQEIVVTQQEEIAAMRRAVGEALPKSEAAPTNPGK